MSEAAHPLKRAGHEISVGSDCEERQGRGGTRHDLATAPPIVHPMVVAAFRALDRADVEWCLLRGEKRLASPPHDVDLLVSASELAKAADALGPLGFLAVPTWGRGSHRFFVAYYEESDHWLLFDVVTELSYGPHYALKTNAARGCLDRRERLGSLVLLGADDAFWTLLLHCVLDRGSVSAHQAERLRALAELALTDTPLARFLDAACPRGWDAGRVLTCARAGEWPALTGLRSELVRRSFLRRPVEVATRIVRGTAERRLASFHTLFRLRGLAIAVVGADNGASMLSRRLAEGFFFPALTLRPILAAPSPPYPLSSAVRLFQVAKASLVSAYHQARGRFVVLEGDALAPWELRTQGFLAHAHRRLFLAASPRLDAAVVLASASARVARPRPRETIVVDRADDLGRKSKDYGSGVAPLWGATKLASAAEVIGVTTVGASRDK